MALMEEDDPHSSASAPLITDVERVEVVAPASLPEGYNLEVVNARDGEEVHSTVVVPPGGVTEGERFIASAQYMNIPNDRWRDGIFSCFALGCLHPVVCVGLFCFPVTMAQVMTRMDLSWIGDYRDPETHVTYVSTFKKVMLVYVIYLMGIYATSANMWKEVWELPMPFFLPMSWWDFLFWVYCFLVVMKTRAYVRRKYSIPERDCTGCEDCCCAFFCLPLTICQMARHTAEYDTYRASPCSENGLPPNAPAIV